MAEISDRVWDVLRPWLNSKTVDDLPTLDEVRWAAATVDRLWCEFDAQEGRTYGG